MTQFQVPATLRQHRPLFLALEAIGWLHMAGKAKVDFLEKYGGQKNNYDYKTWHEQENPPFPWDNLLQWVKGKSSLGNEALPKTLADFLSGHTGRDSGMLGLLQAGHGMASGIEKNLPSETSKYLGQSCTHMWLSTAFGHPVRNLLVNPPAVLAAGGWQLLVNNINTLLRDLEQLGNPTQPHTTDDLTGWWNWREDAIGKTGWLRKAFTSVLAETRLPNNDVTLFDQSYVAAALFKSAAAGAILEGNSFPWDESLKQQTRWRLLTVGLGMDHYEARAVKIGDWTGARLALDEFFTRACKLVEVDLAVGSLLYKDGETCVFSFPGERFDQTDQGGDLRIDAWKSWLTERIDGFAREANFELPPYCHISKPSRSLVPMTREIREARDAMAEPLFRTWHIPRQEAAKGHVCPVCLARRNNAPSDKQQPCKQCKDRRTHRLDGWMEGQNESDTIWISEVTDHNDRVALITMSLDIEPWLDGTRLDSLRAQSVARWAAQNATQKKSLPNDHDSLVNLVKTALGTRNQASQARSLIQKKLAPGLKDGEKDVPWEAFYKLMVEDRADSPSWGAIDDNTRAAWLTHQLFRKLASPGRIYRFQRQAEEFFNDLLGKFREKAAVHANGWRIKRLLLKPASGAWNDREPYNGRCDGKPIDLLYRQDSGGFLTIFNMARLLESTQAKEALQGKTISLKDDNNKTVADLTVQSVEDAPDRQGCYHPVIPLELSPVRFRALVPLCAASDCVDYALAAWEKQFSRVWDRLPLRLGVVAFPRKTPFQAVVEAARNIEDELAHDGRESWQVVQADARDGVVSLCLAPEHDAPHVLMNMPKGLPDGRDDVFYPYLAMQGGAVSFPRDFKHPNGQVYRHVSDVKDGDTIHVHPARVATLFLDGTAKRFERISPWNLASWRQMRELWNLLQRSAPSQTALRGAWAELCERREAWHGPDENWLDGGKEAWLALVRTVFRTRLNMQGADLGTLVQAAADDLLQWCLEWHLNILKEQISGGDTDA